MKLKSISWRNIGPYGNKLQTLDFSAEGALWMVTGKNGNGKSFVVNLPKILYYGKLDKFKKDEIANRLNKHGWIRGEIETKPGIVVTIERAMSPGDLHINKITNGINTDIDKAGITNLQDYLDVEVTGLPYHIFSNIISLSVNDFKSFISMTPNDKRIIIDKLFAMEMINRMNDLVKKDLRDIKINIDIFDREIMTLKSTIENASKELEKLKKRVSEDNSKRIEEITDTLKAYIPKIKEANTKLQEYRNKENQINQSYKIFISQKSQINNDINILSGKITLYDQDKCPTCETPFNDKRFELLRGDLHENLKMKKDELELLENNEIKYTDALIKIREGISKLNEFVINGSAAFRTLQSELKALKMNKPKEFQSIQNIISSGSVSINVKETEKEKIDDDYKYISLLETLYGDAGVKKRILDSYLPTLNKEIEYTLSELHFPYMLKFNNDFEPDLEHLGINIGVETLSTGEKKRVDLAVLISIIRMLKRKYPNLNIFMLDEVLSSIDGDGIYDIIGLLQKTAKELSMNIFIINHSPLPVEYFDFKIEIDKNAGFSDLRIEKLNGGDVN
jgi:DNA repair exonuclease SbcCD ATPase subunit